MLKFNPYSLATNWSIDLLVLDLARQVYESRRAADDSASSPPQQADGVTSFDIFLSYIVYSDRLLAEDIFERLVALGIRPYLDSKFYFVTRREGFDGSLLFVPVMSTAGMISLRSVPSSYDAEAAFRTGTVLYEYEQALGREACRLRRGDANRGVCSICPVHTEPLRQEELFLTAPGPDSMKPAPVLIASIKYAYIPYVYHGQKVKEGIRRYSPAMVTSVLKDELTGFVKLFSQPPIGRTYESDISAVVREACTILRLLTTPSETELSFFGGEGEGGAVDTELDSLTLTTQESLGMSGGGGAHDSSVSNAVEAAAGSALELMLDILVHFEYATHEIKTTVDFSHRFDDFRSLSHCFPLLSRFYSSFSYSRSLSLLLFLFLSLSYRSSLHHRNLDLKRKSSLLSCVPVKGMGRPDISLEALWVILNLITLDAVCRTAFGTLRGCEIVTLILSKYKHKNYHISLKTLKTIAAACQDQPYNRQQFASFAAAADITSTIKFFGAAAEFAATACGTVAACCSGSHRLRDELLSCGFVDVLVSVLKRHCRVRAVVETACKAIAALCDRTAADASSDRARLQLGQREVCTIVLKLISYHCSSRGGAGKERGRGISMASTVVSKAYCSDVAVDRAVTDLSFLSLTNFTHCCKLNCERPVAIGEDVGIVISKAYYSDDAVDRSTAGLCFLALACLTSCCKVNCERAVAAGITRHFYLYCMVS